MAARMTYAISGIIADCASGDQSPSQSMACDAGSVTGMRSHTMTRGARPVSATAHTGHVVGASPASSESLRQEPQPMAIADTEEG